MKHCMKSMLLCVVVGIAIVFLLPKFGVPLAGAPLLFAVLMIGCCVLPMLFMMKSGSHGEEGSCCSKESKGGEENKGVAENVKSSSGSCH